MDEETLKMEKELKFIEESFSAGIISEEEYRSAKKRVEDQLLLQQEKEQVVKKKRTIKRKTQKPQNELFVMEEEQKKAEKPAEVEEITGDVAFNAQAENKPPISEHGQENPKDFSEAAVKNEENIPEEQTTLKEEVILESYDSIETEKKDEMPEENTENEENKEKEEKKGTPQKKSASNKENLPKKSLSISKYLIFTGIILILLIVFFSLRTDKLLRANKIPEQELTPDCDYDIDCQKHGFVGTCLNPSTEEAKCVFNEPATPTNIIVISAEECVLCDTGRMKNTIFQLYPGANYTEMDSEDSQAKSLISSLGINALPAYVFDRSIEQAKRFNSTSSIFTKSNLMEAGEFYLMKPIAAGSTYFFRNKQKQDYIELFITPFASSSKDAFSNLKDFSKKRKVDYIIKYYTRKDISLEDNNIKELIREVCIRSYSDEKLISYLTCIFKSEISEKNSFNCIHSLNIPEDEINKCIEKDGKVFLSDDIAKAEEFSINTLPAFVFNNRYKKGGTMSVPIIEEIYCNVNPDSC